MTRVSDGKEGDEPWTGAIQLEVFLLYTTYNPTGNRHGPPAIGASTTISLVLAVILKNNENTETVAQSNSPRGGQVPIH